MAILYSAFYAGQIDTSDPAGYPWGKAVNDTTQGDGLGTPLEKAWVNDWFGFQAAVFTLANVTPSGVSDKSGACQVLDALDDRFIDRELPVRAALSAWSEYTSTVSQAFAVFDDSTQRVAFGWPISGPSIATRYFNGAADSLASSGNTVPIDETLLSTSTVSGGGVMIVSLKYSSGSSLNRLLRSADGGETWTLHAAPFSSPYSDIHITWSGSKFIMPVPGGFGCYVSTDGTSWAAGGDLQAQQWGEPRFSHSRNGITVIMSGSSFIHICATDDDGATWHQLAATGQPTGVSFSEMTGKWVKTDTYGVWTTGDPLKGWDDDPLVGWDGPFAPTIRAPSGGSYIEDTCSIGGVLVARYGDHIVTSLDGLNWTAGVKTSSQELIETGGQITRFDGTSILRSGSV